MKNLILIFLALVFAAGPSLAAGYECILHDAYDKKHISVGQTAQVAAARAQQKCQNSKKFLESNAKCLREYTKIVCFEDTGTQFFCEVTSNNGERYSDFGISPKLALAKALLNCELNTNAILRPTRCGEAYVQAQCSREEQPDSQNSDRLRQALDSFDERGNYIAK